jgi:hypothetical protein
MFPRTSEKITDILIQSNPESPNNYSVEMTYGTDYDKEKKIVTIEVTIDQWAKFHNINNLVSISGPAPIGPIELRYEDQGSIHVHDPIEKSKFLALYNAYDKSKKIVDISIKLSSEEKILEAKIASIIEMTIGMNESSNGEERAVHSQSFSEEKSESFRPSFEQSAEELDEAENLYRSEIDRSSFQIHLDESAIAAGPPSIDKIHGGRRLPLFNDDEYANRESHDIVLTYEDKSQNKIKVSRNQLRNILGIKNLHSASGPSLIYTLTTTVGHKTMDRGTFIRFVNINKARHHFLSSSKPSSDGIFKQNKRNAVSSLESKPKSKSKSKSKSKLTSYKRRKKR